MNAQDFCYWLQGFLECAEPTGMNERQIGIVKEHLQLVFNKVTPTVIPSTPVKRDDTGLADIWKQQADQDRRMRELLDGQGRHGGLQPWTVTYC